MDATGLLRTEVGLLRQRETRRVFDTSVHVGTLGGARDSWVARRGDVPVVDLALRTDVVSAMLDRERLLALDADGRRGEVEEMVGLVLGALGTH